MFVPSTVAVTQASKLLSEHWLHFHVAVCQLGALAVDPGLILNPNPNPTQTLTLTLILILNLPERA